MTAGRQNQSAGFSLVEVLLASTVMGLLVTGLAGAIIYGQESAALAGQRARAEMLAEEAIEAVRSIRDSAHNELRFAQSGITSAGNQWNFIGEGSSETIGEFTRTISYADVCRDGSGNIATCPSVSPDIHTKKMTVTMSWQPRPGITSTITRDIYLENWDSQDWTQTNWVGGSGQAIWSDTTKYLSDDGNIDTTTAGQVTLEAATTTTQWNPDGGAAQAIDTTDTDFSAGTLTNTAVSGTGIAAKVALSQSVQWALHQDSGIATTQNMNAIDGTSTNNIWAVGASGKILHWNGTSWSEFVDLGADDMRGIAMLSATDGWAVGGNGKIIQYNGTIWAEFQDTGAETWNSVAMVTATDGWAVGSGGSIRRYDGVSWNTVTSPVTNNLNAVFMLSGADGWAVGASGKILHWNGTSWSQFVDTGGDTWNSISMVSATDGWVVADGGSIRRYDGVSWNTVTSPVTNNLNAVYMLSATDGWAVGASGKILHWNGTSWSEFLDTGGTQWNGLFFLSATDGWAAGNGGNFEQYGTLYDPSGTLQSRILDSGTAGTTWNNVFWTEVLPSGADITIATRTGNTATPDGTWSVFSAELTNNLNSPITSPTGRYLQYRATFTRPTAPGQTAQLPDISFVYGKPTTQTLQQVFAVSASDAWAVGLSGTIIHFTGSGWSAVTSPVTNNLNGVYMVSATDGWAVGASGTIIRWNGTTWSTVTSPVTNALNSVFMLSATDGWAVGASGKILHWDGVSWSQFVDTGGETWNAISMVTATDGWVVGSGGAIRQYNGVSWSSVTSPVTGALNGIDMVSATDGWAVGAAGAIIRWNGASWSSVTSPITQAINSVFMLSGADGWAVGASGKILHWNGTSWSEFVDTGGETWNWVYMVSATEGWTVGNTAAIDRYVSTPGGFTSSGSLISSAFNMSNASPVQTIEWSQTIPACSPSCTVRFQLRTAPDSAGSPGTFTAWFGATGPGTFFTSNTGTLVPVALNGNQWVQYQVFLDGDGTNTPILQDVTVNFR